MIYDHYKFCFVLLSLILFDPLFLLVVGAGVGLNNDHTTLYQDITSVNLDNESLLEKSADVSKSADFVFSADQAEPLMKTLLALLTTHILYSGIS